MHHFLIAVLSLPSLTPMEYSTTHTSRRYSTFCYYGQPISTSLPSSCYHVTKILKLLYNFKRSITYLYDWTPCCCVCFLNQKNPTFELLILLQYTFSNTTCLADRLLFPCLFSCTNSSLILISTTLC